MISSPDQPGRRRPGGRPGRTVLRVLVVVGVLLAISSAAYASARATRSNSGAKLSLLTWGDPKYAQGQFALYQKHFPKDAAGQSLNVILGGANDADAVNAFRLRLTAHHGIPDIVELNRSEVAEFAASGQLTNLQPYLSKYIPNMSRAAQTLMQYNGTVVAVPYEVKEKLWFYRKDMFAAAGIEPTKVKTQAQFIGAGHKLRAKFPNSYIWNLAATPQAYILGEITSGNGSQVFNRKTGKFVVATDPGLRKAFQAMAALRASGVVDTEFDDFTPQWQSGLADGTIASVPIGEWFATFLPQYAPKLAGNWGVTTWPEIGGATNGAGSEAGGSVFVVPKASKNPAAAAKFLADMYMTKTGSLLLSRHYNGIPNVVAAQNDPSVKNNPYYGAALINAFKAASPTYKIFPYDPAAISEITILNNALDTFLASGSSDPSSALQSAQHQLTAQLGNPYHH
jgi:ABC-type glycerol-3-phosphate transport system substrate-binding protein